MPEVKFEVIRGVGKKSGNPWKAIKLLIDDIPAWNSGLWFPTDMELKVFKSFFDEIGYNYVSPDPYELAENQKEYIDSISN